MSKYSDQKYLLTQQYRDDTNLQARIYLHQRFSTNPYSWFLWVFEQFHIPERGRILELGCGPGDLWAENAHRVPSDWDITLSDFSIGMLHRTRENLRKQKQAGQIQFKVIDAQAIPYVDGSFDIVIANFMLYHVPERDKALSEIHRVLKPRGRLYAATVGERHMKELFELVARFDADLAAEHRVEKNEFTLESGYSQLSRWFDDIKVCRQENALRVTEVEPLVDYVLSSFRLGVAKERRQEFSRFVEQEIAERGGAIWITKDIGMFEASF